MQRTIRWVHWFNFRLPKRLGFLTSFGRQGGEGVRSRFLSNNILERVGRGQDFDEVFSFLREISRHRLRKNDFLSTFSLFITRWLKWWTNRSHGWAWRMEFVQWWLRARPQVPKLSSSRSWELRVWYNLSMKSHPCLCKFLKFENRLWTFFYSNGFWDFSQIGYYLKILHFLCFIIISNALRGGNSRFFRLIDQLSRSWRRGRQFSYVPNKIVYFFRVGEDTKKTDFCVTDFIWTVPYCNSSEREDMVIKGKTVGILRYFHTAFKLLNLHNTFTLNSRTKYIVTGHSLGGALASIYGMVMAGRRGRALWHNRKSRLITFGAPRVGDERFVVFHNKWVTYLPLSHGSPLVEM